MRKGSAELDKRRRTILAIDISYRTISEERSDFFLMRDEHLVSRFSSLNDCYILILFFCPILDIDATAPTSLHRLSPTDTHVNIGLLGGMKVVKQYMLMSYKRLDARKNSSYRLHARSKSRGAAPRPRDFSVYPWLTRRYSRHLRYRT